MPGTHATAAADQPTRPESGPNRRIYLDHAATSPLRPEARQIFVETLEHCGANPASVHLPGQAARRVIEDARDRVAAALRVEADEILFTGSGTESDNLAVRGLAWAADRETAPRLVTSAIEHSAVRRSVAWLADRGDVEAVEVPALPDGTVDPQVFLDAANDNTCVASLMAANNETGVVQPIGEVGRALAERGVPFHVDAVTALGKRPVFPGDLPCDLLTLSAHKAGGPPGLGVLHVRRGLKLQPLYNGGSQEHGLRPGTPFPALVAAGAWAIADAIEHQAAHAARLSELTARLEDGLLALDGVGIHGREADRLPGMTCAWFEGVVGSQLLRALDVQGFAVSAGSACTSGSSLPSHVLTVMGVDTARASGSLRLSLSASQDLDDIEAFLEALPPVLQRLRSASSVEHASAGKGGPD
ncbi:MAG: cysteine desulfurase family protein [Acidobacteriota bacterium]